MERLSPNFLDTPCRAIEIQIQIRTKRIRVSARAREFPTTLTLALEHAFYEAFASMGRAWRGGHGTGMAGHGIRTLAGNTWDGHGGEGGIPHAPRHSSVKSSHSPAAHPHPCPNHRIVGKGGWSGGKMGKGREKGGAARNK